MLNGFHLPFFIYLKQNVWALGLVTVPRIAEATTEAATLLSLLVSCVVRREAEEKEMRLSTIFVALLTVGAFAQNQPATSNPAFRGTYEQLNRRRST